MKKFLVILSAFLFLSADLIAQDDAGIYYTTPEKTIDYQIRGGINISNVIGFDGGDTYRGDTKIGYNISGIAQIKLKENFIMQTGLSLTSKGTKISDLYDTDYGYYDAEMNAVYLQVPLYFGGRFNLQNDAKMGFVLGPYFAYGIAGKTGIEGRRLNGTINTFGSDGIWNRPDVGLGFEVSLEINRFVLVLGEDIGLSRAWKKRAMDIYNRNQTVYLSVGFVL